MRTFIAVPLPEQCRAMLAELQRQMKPLGADVRWTAVPSIHLTLKFLGEVDPALLPKMAEALRIGSAGYRPFQLRLHALGAFPNARNPRVVWCGFEGELERLNVLQAKVESACAEFGFPPEDRPFRPHLTLGRVQGKKNLQGLLDYIRIGSELEQPFAVDRFNLYRSVLTPKGAIYTVLDTIELSRQIP